MKEKKLPMSTFRKVSCWDSNPDCQSRIELPMPSHLKPFTKTQFYVIISMQ